MTVAQITGYLPRQDAESFQTYAASMGIDKSSLANLLIRRELILNRMATLVTFQHHEPRALCIKVTAHLTDESAKAAFTAAAERCGLRPGNAASLLFRAEIAERWLERAITA